MSLKALRDKFAGMMGWAENNPDRFAVDFVLSSYIAPAIVGSTQCPWADLIGGPSTGKGELFRMLKGHPRTVWKDHLTENSLTSAYRDPNNPNKDNALLTELQRATPPIGHKALVLPEMNTIYEMKMEKAATIISALRSAYDGDEGWEGSAGNIGRHQFRELNFAVLGACTEASDRFRKHNQTLGERTIVYRIGMMTRKIRERRRTARHCMKEDPKAKAACQAELRADTHALLDATLTRMSTSDVVTIPDHLSDIAGDLSLVACSFRIWPLSLKDEDLTNSVENAARIAKQVRAWGDAHALLDGRTVWDESDVALVRRITQYTPPPDMLRLAKCLWRRGPEDAVLPMNRSLLAHKALMRTNLVTTVMKQWAIADNVEIVSSEEVRFNPEMVEVLVDCKYWETL